MFFTQFDSLAFVCTITLIVSEWVVGLYFPHTGSPGGDCTRPEVSVTTWCTVAP